MHIFRVQRWIKQQILLSWPGCAHLGNDALAIVEVALMLVYLPIFSSTITF